MSSDYSTITAPLLEGLVLGIDHVGICVRDLDEAGRAWASLLGFPMVDREDVAPAKATAAFVRVPIEEGEKPQCAVELVTPMAGNVGLEKFLDKRGDAMHHIAVAVSDIEEALARLKKAGVRLIDEVPRPGAGGHLVAFLHPKAMGGSLVELVQRSH